MLARKRGAANSTRKMAKKTPAALQAEVTNDEEWAKILEKKGLIVVDIYSEWSGPCSGMVSILKKIKMELGGDILSYCIAKCDNITSLQRFRGKSEPTWMFIHDGQMVNLMFGADCPKLYSMLTRELQRVQNGESHEFSIPVTERSPEEEERLRILEEVRIAKEAARKAQKEAEAKAKYEAEMLHFTTSLKDQTCLLLYPWIFKDEEGRKRDKKSSPPYVDLIEEVLMEKFTVEEEQRKRLDEEVLEKILEEADYKPSEESKKLLLDGRCMFMRLKLIANVTEMSVEEYLITLLLEIGKFPQSESDLVEGSYAERHKPSFPLEKEDAVYPLFWAPTNSKNKVDLFRLIFAKYILTNCPYEDKSCNAPIIVFKYDNTRKNELKVVLEMYDSEIVHFGIFERDQPPEAKLVATSIEEFETKPEERSGYEVYVCVVKKTGSEIFLTFAGIGPYYVSENLEKAIKESQLYFPDVAVMEEPQSDEEDKIDELEGNPEGEPTEAVQIA